MSDQKNNGSENEVDSEKEQLIDNEKISNRKTSEEIADESGEKIEKKDESIDDLHAKLTILQDESKSNLDKAVRAQAEMENLRKRTVRDIENAHKYALEKFVQELLPVIDSLELGLSASAEVENADDLRKGMDLTLEMIKKVMEKFGIAIVEAQGQKFNPELHEAVSTQEAGEYKPGEVIAVMQKGYTLNGRLIRPAMVVVAK